MGCPPSCCERIVSTSHICPIGYPAWFRAGRRKRLPTVHGRSRKAGHDGVCPSGGGEGQDHRILVEGQILFVFLNPIVQTAVEDERSWKVIQ